MCCVVGLRSGGTRVDARGDDVSGGGAAGAHRGLDSQRHGILQPETQVLHAHRRRPPHARR